MQSHNLHTCLANLVHVLLKYYLGKLYLKHWTSEPGTISFFIILSYAAYIKPNDYVKRIAQRHKDFKSFNIHVRSFILQVKT
jgi:hypothetical protein